MTSFLLALSQEGSRASSALGLVVHKLLLLSPRPAVRAAAAAAVAAATAAASAGAAAPPGGAARLCGVLELAADCLSPGYRECETGEVGSAPCGGRGELCA